jgi:uncharacterized membrane protein YtjA (UPF0391 family)
LQTTVQKKGGEVLNYSIAFIVMALIAAFFGYSGTAPMASEFAKLMFFIFLAIALISITADVFYFK